MYTMYIHTHTDRLKTTILCESVTLCTHIRTTRNTEIAVFVSRGTLYTHISSTPTPIDTYRHITKIAEFVGRVAALPKIESLKSHAVG
jgi:hypothetical protein